MCRLLLDPPRLAVPCPYASCTPPRRRCQLIRAPRARLRGGCIPARVAVLHCVEYGPDEHPATRWLAHRDKELASG